MSTDPVPQLPAVLRGATPTSRPGVDEKPAATVDLVTETATSRHQQVVTAALRGASVVVETDADGGVLLAGLLAALAAAGRRVTLLPGSSTDAARTVLTDLALGHLLDDTAEDVSRRGADLPPADPARWATVFRELAGRTRAWHATTDGTPSRTEALARLEALRAEHVDPPLHPAARDWTVADRTRITGMLSGTDPGADDPAARPAAGSPTAPLDALPGELERLHTLSDRLVADLGWRSPRTLGDLDRALDLLARVDTLTRTYVPAALRTDLDQAQAILDRPQRSLLSGEERERRRELRRLAGLRVDGAGFTADDVRTLRGVQQEWSGQSGGGPVPWPARTELAQSLDAVRRRLPQVSSVLTGVPADLADTELAATDDLVAQARRAAGAARQEHRATALRAEGLSDVAAAVPPGADAGAVARLVDGVWWRALAETAPGDEPTSTEDLVREFRTLDGLRRSRAVRELQLALAGARARPVHVGDASEDVLGECDVLVVDAADRFDGDRLADLVERAGVVVLLGSAATASATSAWSRAAGALGVHALRRTAPVTDAGLARLREDVATALRAAGLDVSAGAEVADGPVDLLVGPEGGPVLALDLEASVAGLTVQDREVARPARLRRAGTPYRVLRSAEWSAGPGELIDRIVGDFGALGGAPGPAAPAPAAAARPEATSDLPRGLGSAADADATVGEFLAGLAGGHPNVDRVPAAAVDAAVALAYGRLGTAAGDTAVLEAAMELLGFRRRGTKVLRVFKESLQRGKKRMRGAGVKIS